VALLGTHSSSSSRVFEEEDEEEGIGARRSRRFTSQLPARTALSGTFRQSNLEAIPPARDRAPPGARRSRHFTVPDAQRVSHFKDIPNRHTKAASMPRSYAQRCWRNDAGPKISGASLRLANVSATFSKAKNTFQPEREGLFHAQL
jgi:hypothetical protein